MKSLALICTLLLSSCSSSSSPFSSTETEPNNTIAQADDLGTVPPGTTINGTIQATSGEFDVFRVALSLPDLPATAALDVFLNQDDAATDVVILVLDSSGAPIATIDGGAAGAPESGLVPLSLAIVPDGVVYLSIFSIGPASEYRLDVTQASAVPATTPPPPGGVPLEPGLSMAELARRIIATKQQPARRVLRQHWRVERIDGRPDQGE
jgi:hypothetical protein